MSERLLITKEVIHEIFATVGSYPPETGGILGAGSSGVISHYYYDRTGKSSVNGYAPDIDAVNSILTDYWMPNGVLMVGIIHSHSNGVSVPSCGDINYGIRILEALDTVDSFYLPILTRANGIPELICFEISRDSDGKYCCKRIDFDICD